MKNPGMRIVTHIERVPHELVEKFKDAPAANVADCSGRLFAMNASIHPMGKGKKLCGTAVTVKSAIADNGMFHKAMSMAQPGDIMVVNACGDTNHSVCGDVMFRYAMSKHLGGMIIDGCVRDLDFLQNTDFPVFALGATPRGPYKNPVGEINTDIACGGQVIHPGDLVIGDEDGVVVVRKEDAETIWTKLQTTLKNEAHFTELLESGTWDEESPLLKKINAQIEELGFEII